MSNLTPLPAFLLYLAGVATPIFLYSLYFLRLTLTDYLYDRRYKRAWVKFSAEFDNLGPAQLAEYRALWQRQHLDYRSLYDDRSRFFKMRWQFGRTTEV